MIKEKIDKRGHIDSYIYILTVYLNLPLICILSLLIDFVITSCMQ